MTNRHIVDYWSPEAAQREKDRLPIRDYIRWRHRCIVFSRRFRAEIDERLRRHKDELCELAEQEFARLSYKAMFASDEEIQTELYANVSVTPDV